MKPILIIRYDPSVTVSEAMSAKDELRHVFDCVLVKVANVLTGISFEVLPMPPITVEDGKAWLDHLTPEFKHKMPDPPRGEGTIERPLPIPIDLKIVARGGDLPYIEYERRGLVMDHETLTNGERIALLESAARAICEQIVELKGK